MVAESAQMGIKVALAPGARMPSYATNGAAGMDLYSLEEVELQPMERKLVPTGVRIAIPPGYEGQVRPRSGLALKKGVGFVNSPGTIDADYRGEIGVIAINFSSDVVKLPQGERIAQLVICPIARAQLFEVPAGGLDETQRGEGGFGSTGSG
jgi:dUTP pyrophosphatase